MRGMGHAEGKGKGGSGERDKRKHDVSKLAPLKKGRGFKNDRKERVAIHS